jgi:two-component system LytT family sensor kinase
MASPPLQFLHRPLVKWTALFGIWTVVGLVFVVQYYIFHLTENVNFTTDRAVWTVLGWYPWIVLTPVVVHLARRLPIERPFALPRLGAHIALAFLFSLLEVILVVAAMAGFAVLVDNPEFDFARTFRIAFLRSFFIDMVLYMMIGAAVHAIDYYQKYRERDLRTAYLEMQLVQAQLQALRMQLNPHFLFNTLHAISALMDEDVRDARRMMTSLSELLRYSLDSESEAEVPLEQELAVLKRYVQIEQVRFQDRLTVAFDIAPDTLDALVPTLILQPLVENAIKHGIAPYAAAGRIEIRARRDHGALVLQVSDNGPGLRKRPADGVREGIGLKNTRERLLQLYGTGHTFNLATGAGGGFTVTLAIPFHSDVYLMAT